MKDFVIKSASDIEEATLYFGFLPFFKNNVPGFSIAEHTPKEYWFSSDRDGPWEWKDPVIQNKKCAYGKFFRGRAGYIDVTLLPDFCNYRRDGYDLDALYEDGKLAFSQKQLYDTVVAETEILSPELRDVCCYGIDGKKGYDQAVTKLQMQTYLTFSGIEYEIGKNGKVYGWGVAKFTTPENLYGKSFIRSAYKKPPEKSFEKLLKRLKDTLPEADEKSLIKLIK